MEAGRQVVLSIAGFDPSGGAGILADIKTFEQHKVYGLGINTALTLQTENDFFATRWEDGKNILDALETMLASYNIKAIKIGIIENLERLDKIVSLIHEKNKEIKIVVDTIIRSSTGFDFWSGEINENIWGTLLPKIFLITPNYEEAIKLVPSPDAKTAAKKLSAWCNVLLKGVHNTEETGVDYLYMKENRIEKLKAGNILTTPKHGSGCVLSAAITANLALGYNMVDSCNKAKNYTEQFLNSNPSLLGYHNV